MGMLEMEKFLLTKITGLSLAQDSGGKEKIIYRICNNLLIRIMKNYEDKMLAELDQMVICNGLGGAVSYQPSLLGFLQGALWRTWMFRLLTS
jgi:hypothetical protein